MPVGGRRARSRRRPHPTRPRPRRPDLGRPRPDLGLDRRVAGQAGGHERGADDAGVVAQGGGHDLRLDAEPGHESVGVLADPAAEDEQPRREQPLDGVHVLVEVGRPGLPRQAPPEPCGRGGSPLRVAAPDLHVPELGVRHEDALGEDRGADAGAEGEQDHGVPPALRGAEPDLGDARRIRIVDDPDVPADRLLEAGIGREADPARVDVGRGLRDPVDDDARHRDADRGRRLAAGPAQALDQPGDRGDDVGRRGRIRRDHPQPVAHQSAGGEVDRRGLDPAAADVDPDRRTPFVAHCRPFGGDHDPACARRPEPSGRANATRRAQPGRHEFEVRRRLVPPRPVRRLSRVGCRPGGRAPPMPRSTARRLRAWRHRRRRR